MTTGAIGHVAHARRPTLRRIGVITAYRDGIVDAPCKRAASGSYDGMPSSDDMATKT